HRLRIRQLEEWPLGESGADRLLQSRAISLAVSAKRFGQPEHASDVVVFGREADDADRAPGKKAPICGMIRIGDDVAGSREHRAKIPLRYSVAAHDMTVE